jgi:hypothetical protein
MTNDLLEAKAANSGNALITNYEDVSTKAAMQLRNEIKTQDVSQPWPPDTDQNVIPASVTQILYTL